jgi:hypothetical protein
MDGACPNQQSVTSLLIVTTEQMNFSVDSIIGGIEPTFRPSKSKAFFLAVLKANLGPILPHTYFAT